jgi:putative DNA primase/helicase
MSASLPAHLLASLPEALRHRLEAAYDYTDPKGRLLYQVLRLRPKDFRQRRPIADGRWEWSLGDVRRVLYCLPQLLAAPTDAWVFVVEGEKDADNLARLGLVATTCAMGAGKWRPEYNAALRGRPVVILPDNDEPGRQHARQVAAALAGTAESVRILELPGLPSKGDVSDWLARPDHTADALCQLAQEVQNAECRVQNEDTLCTLHSALPGSRRCP